jgi:hypothetical protein
VEDDSSPAVLLSSGYIAGGAIAAVMISFMNFRPWILDKIDFAAKPVAEGLTNKSWFAGLLPEWWFESTAPALVAFGVLCLVLLVVGASKRGSPQASQ